MTLPHNHPAQITLRRLQQLIGKAAFGSSSDQHAALTYAEQLLQYVPAGLNPGKASEAVGTFGSSSAPENVPELREALREAKCAINSMKAEAETAAQGDEQMMLEACEQISEEGLEASLAIDAVLGTWSMHQIQEPEADVWPCVNIDVDESGKITNAKLYSPGLPAGNHDVYPVRVPYMDEHTEAWLACVAELRKHLPKFMSGNMNGIACAVAAIRELAERPAPALAAPAAVAVPDGAMGLLEALESMVDVCEGHDFDGAPSDAHMEKARAAISAYRAALAATPAAEPTLITELKSILADANVGPPVDGVGCCKECGKWTPWRHLEAHDHEEGCTAPHEHAKRRDWKGRLSALISAPPAAAALGMVSITKEDANNYCRILAMLGMEEEGDPVAEVENLQALAVTSILLDVVPGADGMGHEVYATSVEDVVEKLSDLGSRLEDYQLGITVVPQALTAHRDAAFEAVRKAFCKLQRYSFFLDDKGNVRRTPDYSGNWVEFEAVHTLFEAAAVDAAIAAQAAQESAHAN